MKKEQNLNTAKQQALNIPVVSGRFFEVFDKENDYNLAVDLKNYVNEHIFKHLVNNYDLKITYREWLSQNDR
jgi:hypothetical protein